MKRIALGSFLLLMVVMVAFARYRAIQNVKLRNAVDSEEPLYSSNTSPEDCYLCGGGIERLIPDRWGQNNIALFSLNTFEIKPFTVNRYDITGQLLEEYTGTVSFGGSGSVDGGFSAVLLQDYDRGYAVGMVDLYNDRELDVSKAADFLCEKCLNEILDGILPWKMKEAVGIGAINLATKEVGVFEESTRGFGLGDFYIDCYLHDKKEQMDISIFYCPIRYETKS